MLDRQRAVLDRFPPGGLVSGWVTLVGHDLMSDELVAAASTLARERGTHLTFHLSPSASDPAAYLARTGRRPLVHLEQLGALGPHVLVAHAVHVDDEELEVLLRTATAVAACPWAYLRLGQGVTMAGRHAELFAAGWAPRARLRQRERRRPGRSPARRGAVRRAGQGRAR